MNTSFAEHVTEETFEEQVLRRSFEAPVVVDFWAEWCGPCRTLGPLLERLAQEADGAWTLAKVDVDSNPRLAAAFEVQGIPAVHAFKDGREVSEFVGALPEDQVRAWLDRLGPTPGDLAVEEGRAAEARGDLEAAAESYRRALLEEPAHAEARTALERVELTLRSGGLDEDGLRARLDADPGDVEAAIGLADLEAARGALEAAFNLLLDVVRATAGDERELARKHLLRLLDTIAPDDARAVAARRSLSLALF
ncbi:MAG: thioredoxin [Actinomycetota bacterium]